VEVSNSRYQCLVVAMAEVVAMSEVAAMFEAAAMSEVVAMSEAAATAGLEVDTAPALGSLLATDFCSPESCPGELKL
jgi:hypothetical protein